MLNVFVPNVLFIIFSAILLLSALMVISVRNPVKSALFLVLCFFAATGLWLLLNAEFLALILILVYVGAVMTLFLFVVMTLNTEPSVKSKTYLPLGLFFTALLSGLLIYVLSRRADINFQNMHNLNILSTEQLGRALYTQYALPFEITGIILLVAIIAAISLSLFQPISSKHQVISEQINTRKQDRLRKVK